MRGSLGTPGAAGETFRPHWGISRPGGVVWAVWWHLIVEGAGLSRAGWSWPSQKPSYPHGRTPGSAEDR